MTLTKKRKNGSAAQADLENFDFSPGSQTQAEAMHDFEEGYNLFLDGYAGTGKTFLAVALGLKMIRDGQIDKILLIRSCVPTRDIGFLPGTEKQKMEKYEKVLRKTVNKLAKRDDAYGILSTKGLVEFASSSFERGDTYYRTLVIIEEAQNMTFHEIDTLVTRLHKSSRIIITGDTRQTDLLRGSGYSTAVKVADRMPGFFRRHSFEIKDILRGEFCKAWIVATEEVFRDEG